MQAEELAIPIYLSDIFDPKKNSFGFLRFSLAVLVIFSHSYPLGGFGSEGLFGSNQETYGGFAVSSFFVLSGFLIRRSYTTSSSVWHFIWNRIIRIIPGFWANLIVTVLLFAPIIYLSDNRSLIEYFNCKSNNPLDYIKANFFIEMKQFGIADLMKDNPHSQAFNGSLWTLIYEVKCYLLIAFLGWLDILKNFKFFIAYLFLFTYIVHLLNIGIPGTALRIFPYFSDIYNLSLAMYFFSGASYFMYLENIIMHKKIFLFAIILTVLGVNNNFYHLIAPLTLPYILLFTAIKLPFNKFDMYGDFSYGLYIYAFPVQQILSFFRYNKKGLPAYFMSSLCIAMIFSVFSYYCVEKPFLQLKVRNNFRSKL